MSSPKCPTVFLSYSRDNARHNAWVAKLATDLSANSVSVVLDQWDLRAGDLLVDFMESAVSNCEHIVLICTQALRRKVAGHRGGAAYESAILTAELLLRTDGKSIIPVLREGDVDTAIPTFAKSRLYVDFRDDVQYGPALKTLLDSIHRVNHRPEAARSRVNRSEWRVPSITGRFHCFYKLETFSNGNPLNRAKFYARLLKNDQPSGPTLFIERQTKFYSFTPQSAAAACARFSRRLNEYGAKIEFHLIAKSAFSPLAPFLGTLLIVTGFLAKDGQRITQETRVARLRLKKRLLSRIRG